MLQQACPEREPRAGSAPAAASAAFVISTGRCGSTLLSSLLRAHPQLLSLSEFFSMLGGGSLLERGEVSGEALWSALRTPQTELAWALRAGPIPELLASRALTADACATLPPPLLTTLPHLDDEPERLLEEIGARLQTASTAPVAAHLTSLFAWLCRRADKSLWVERSGGSAEYGALLLGAFHHARAIFLVRDGAECALSMSRHPLFRLRVARLLRGAALDARSCLALDLPLECFGLYWSAVMQRSWKTFTQASHAMVICYEDLLIDPARELGRVAAFLRLDAAHDAAWRTASAPLARGARPVSWAGVSAETRSRLERSCRPGQRCLERFRGARR